MLRQVAADKLDLLRVDLPIDVLRRAGNAAGSEKSGLYASILVLDGKAIEHVAVVRLPDKDGEAVREEELDSFQRLEPVHHHTLYLQRETQVLEQLRGPGARCQDQTLRLV